MGSRETLRALRDRGDLDPWLNGETDVYFRQSNEPMSDPLFDSGPASNYTFRPKPKPVLRPWTADELWEHRDCWFRHLGYAVPLSSYDVSDKTACLDGFWYSPDQLLAWEYTRDGVTWHPCGKMETQP